MRNSPLQHSTARTEHATSADREFLPESAFLACIRKERQRSDRSRATLSLISLRLPKQTNNAYDSGLDYALEGILRRVRLLDEVGWLEPGVVGILLPETQKDGAWRLVKDLQRQ